MSSNSANMPHFEDHPKIESPENFLIFEKEVLWLLVQGTESEIEHAVGRVMRKWRIGSTASAIIPIIITAITARLENVKLKSEVARLIDEILSTESDFDAFSEHECSLEIGIDGTILSVNDFMINLSGYSRGELIGKNARIMNSGTHSKEFWGDFWNTILAGRVWAGDICNKKKDGSYFWLWTLVIPKVNKDGSIRNFRVMRQDVSISYTFKQQLDDAMSQKNDPPTGLPSHIRCLEDCSEGKDRSLALFHINNMSEINNVYGREVGNLIIKRTGDILRSFCLQNENFNIKLYKFEGTDFALVFNNDVDKNLIHNIFEKLNSTVFSREGVDIHLSFSAGVVINDSNIESLIRRSHIALKHSKQIKSCVILDEPEETIKESQDFFKMQGMIREAWKEDLFAIYAQEVKSGLEPTTGIYTKKYECLIRMYDSKEKTNIMLPGKFLPVIKKNGENKRLTLYILERMCVFMSHNDYHFSINLTADDIYSSKSIEKIHNTITRFGISPGRFVFEILEDINLLESATFLENIKLLKKYGFRIAIDDFGTDHANFSSILYIEPDIIKIDIKYTRGIDKNQKNASLVRAIVMFAHENEIKVIAEGVETESEATALRMLRVDYLQGWLFGKAKPIETINS